MTEGNVFSSLGINPVYLVGQIINFTILFLLLKKFLYRPILKKLEERSKLIATGLKAAEENIKKQEAFDAEREKQLLEAQQEIAVLITQAKKDSERVKEETLAEARNEAEKIMIKKQQEIAEILERQEKELRNKMVDISAAVARKILEDYLDSNNQKEIVESQIRKIAQTKVK